MEIGQDRDFCRDFHQATRRVPATLRKYAMSEHVWAQENIAAYVAGGLEASEAERLEKHAADCATCAQDIDDARSLEKKLAPLVLAADPGPALEDRIIQSLPQVQARPWINSMPRKRKAILAAAAAVLLAVVGAGVSMLIEQKGLGFPSDLPLTMAYAVKDDSSVRPDIVGGTVHSPDSLQGRRRKAKAMEPAYSLALPSADDLATEIRDQTVAQVARDESKPFAEPHLGADTPAPTYRQQPPRPALRLPAQPPAVSEPTSGGVASSPAGGLVGGKGYQGLLPSTLPRDGVSNGRQMAGMDLGTGNGNVLAWNYTNNASALPNLGNDLLQARR